jgi:hypothetical protein
MQDDDSEPRYTPGVKNTPSLSRRQRLLLYGIMVLMVFGGVEISLQIFYFVSTNGSFLWQRSARPFYELDPIRGYRIKPNLSYKFNTNEFQTMVYTDDQGYRTSEAHVAVPRNKPRQRKRLLHFGNSFTFGWGLNYEETYPVLLNETLKNAGHNVDFLNAGIPGQGPSQYFCWLQEAGHVYEADLIIDMRYDDLSHGLLFADLAPVTDPCSQVADYVIEDGYIISSGFGNKEPDNKTTIEPTPLSDRLWKLIRELKHSAAVFYSYHAYNGILRVLHRTEKVATLLLPKTIILKDRYDRSVDWVVASYRKYLEYAKTVNGPETEVLFLYIPPSYVVHREDIPRWRGLVDTKQLDVLLHNNQIIVQALRNDGIRIIDMTPLLAQRALQERMYYWLDAHLTAAGGRVVAEALAEEVEQIFARE